MRSGGLVIAVLMNRVETALINSAPRRILQRWYEVPWLLRLGGALPAGARVLEVGCGPGYGTQLILERFAAASVDAIDLDPAMVARARRRLQPHANRVRLRVGDAADLEAGAGSYDAVFDFAVIHHIPTWRDAVTGIARVLRPGGTFYFDEVTASALARPTYRALFDHPAEDRFSAAEFLRACESAGLDVGDRFITRVGGDYVLGAARRR